MKMLGSVYNDLSDHLKFLDKEISKYHKAVIEAAGDNDLSENEAYDEAKKSLKTAQSEYIEISNILNQATIVHESKIFNIVDVGVWFHLKVTAEGEVSNPYDGSNYRINVDSENKETRFEGNIIIGGPTDKYVSRGIFNSDSPLMKFLDGKSEGTYKYINKLGVQLKVEVSACR